LREGTTDSEALFLVALSQGLTADPQKALERTLRLALETMDHHRADEPLRASLAVTDGRHIWAIRYSNDRQSPSLYFGKPHTRALEHFPNDYNTIASEPSDSDAAHWHRVDEAVCVHWTREALTQKRLEV
jgi:glutamine amidotransferase